MSIPTLRPILNRPPRRELGLVARGLAGLAAVVLVPLALYGTFWAWLGIGIGAQTPDAQVPDGDPCCGHPDTWFETISWTIAGLLWAIVCAAVVALCVAVLWWATKGRALSLRRAWAVGLAVVIVQPVAFVVLWLTGA